MNAQTKIQSPNVYQRLNAARAAFHATKLKKTGKNTFAGYQYFELGDFLVPALKIFAEHGLCATISFSPDLASMRIVNADNPEDWTCITSPMGSAALKGCHEVQNIGAVETYQRRYLWVAALEIVEHDALDATTGRDTGQSEERTVSPQQPITSEQVVRLQSLIKATSSNTNAFCNLLGVQKLPDITANRFDEALGLLETKLARMAKAATDAKAKTGAELADEIQY